MRVFLAVHLPRLQLEVFRPRWLPEPAHGCVVLGSDKVLIVDGVARSAGVRVGMKRGGVLTLAPEVEMYERDPGREHAAQREVAVALMQFSPDVAVLEEAVVVVDIGASLRLFGGLLAVCRQAKAILDAIGLTARIHALRNPGLLSNDEAAQKIFALPRSAFWTIRRELVLALRERLRDASAQTTEQLVKRILQESPALYSDFEITQGRTGDHKLGTIGSGCS